MMFRAVSGTIDGVNRSFDTDHPYIAGSVHVWAPNLQPKSFVTELGGTAYEVERAPLAGDVWILLYDVP